MSIKQQKEYYIHLDADNTIIELKESYIDGSVKAKVENGVDVEIQEIGQKYIRLVDTPTLGDKILITYDISVITESDNNILDILNELEKKVADQTKLINTLVIAMNNRVDKHTFNVWLKAVENRFGKPVLENNLVGIQAVQLGGLD